jgi:oligosaccharide repeat unit polymerase
MGKKINVRFLIFNLLLVGLIIFFALSIIPDILFSTKYILPWALITTSLAIYGFTIFKTKDVFNPVGIFSLIWIFTIGLSNFKLSAWQTNWSTKMWVVVSLVYLSFLLGYFLVRRMKIGKETSFLSGEPSEEKFKKFIYILFIVCFIAYIADVAKSGFLPIFAQEMGAYKAFGIRFVHYFTVSLVLVNLLITLYYFKYKKISKMFILIYIISFLCTFTLLSRQLLILLVVTTVITVHYLFKKIKITHLGLIMLVGFIGFAILGNLRSNSANYIIEVGRMTGGVDSPIFTWLYLYLGYSYENLNYYINNFNDLFWGSISFFPVFAFTLTKGFIQTDLIKFLPYSDLTTGTMAYDFYLDFGIIGVIVLPLLIGGLSSFMYSKLKQNSFFSVIFYAMIAHNLLFAFFINFFANTSWVFYIGILTIFIFYTKYDSIPNPFMRKKVRN